MTKHHNGCWQSGTSRLRSGRAAFTLFEVILAIALSTVLLGLIGAAINLYLTRIEARRVDVEFSQLARSVFGMIGDDMRAASEYKPQSMTGALAAAGSSSSVLSSLDSTSGSSGGSSGTGSGGTGGTGGTGNTVSAFGSSSTGSSSSGTGSSSSTSTNSSSTTTTSTGGIEAANMTTTPGVYGTLNELYIDTSRPPRLDQLLKSYAGYTNIAVPNIAPEVTANGSMPRTATGQASHLALSDLKTVHYFYRQGQEVTDTSSVTITSLSPTAQKDQLLIGGLIRQDIDRAQRLAAEELGDQTTLDSGQKLIAPEVVGMEFRYFDGTQVLETWDTKVNGGLPPAIEVRLWLADPNEIHAAEATGAGILASRAAAREFRQTIFLPLAKPASTTTTDSTSSSGTTSSTGTSGTSSSAGGSTP